MDMATTTDRKDDAIMFRTIIIRREINPGTYEYRYGPDAGEHAGAIITAKSKKLYTHVRWFDTTDYLGEQHSCFVLCTSLDKAERASKARWERGEINAIIDHDEHEERTRATAPNIALGRKLYAGMGWGKNS
jgi:hypothetical protein